jgi:ABC-type multidrug transport system ATPase subunit
MPKMPDTHLNASPALAPVLQATALHWPWDTPAPWRFDALEVPPGVTWIGGGEGRGKTTLLRVLAGDVAAPGTTLVLSGLHAPGTVAFRQRVFWMDPRTEAFDQVSATQFFASTAAHYPAWDTELLAHLVDALGLVPHQDKPLYMLSTGSKRKVWLAAALASGATLTLLDAPFAALDKASIGHLLEFLNAAAQHPKRAWVVADYVPPNGVPLAHTLDLGD